MDNNYLDPSINPFIYKSKFPQKFIFILIFVFLSLLFLSYVTVLQLQKYFSFKIAYISSNLKQIKINNNKKKYLLKKKTNNDEDILNSANLMLLQSSSSNVNISPLFDLYLDKLDYQKIKDTCFQNSSREQIMKEAIDKQSQELLSKFVSKSSSDLEDIEEEKESNTDFMQKNHSLSSGEYLENQSSIDVKSPESQMTIDIIEPVFTPDKIVKRHSLNVITNSNSNSAASFNSSQSVKSKGLSPSSILDHKKEKSYFANMNTLPGSINNTNHNMNPFIFKNSKAISRTKERRESKKTELKTINEMDPHDLLFEVLNHK